MRKFVITVIIGSMLFVAASCSKTEATDGSEAAAGTVQSETSQRIANPWTEYTDLKEANAAAGTSFVLPDEYRSSSTAYRAIRGDILEIDTVADTLNVCFRVKAGNKLEDISGDVNTYSQLIESRCMGIACYFRSDSTDEAVVAYWNDGNASYSIVFGSAVSISDAQEVMSSLIEANTMAY